MIKNFVNFLEAAIDTVETTAATTTSNVFLDENEMEKSIDSDKVGI